MKPLKFILDLCTYPSFCSLSRKWNNWESRLNLFLCAFGTDEKLFILNISMVFGPRQHIHSVKEINGGITKNDTSYSRTSSENETNFLTLCLRSSCKLVDQAYFYVKF